MQINKDLPNKKITITRNFDASPEEVWKTWTQSKYLDQWWAPKPWKAETKTFEFKEGGHWLYAMVGPNNEKHWARVDYISIDDKKSFQAADAFCDENGNLNKEMPKMNWKNTFQSSGNDTKVTVEISFTKEADMTQILQMGFEEGFKMGLENLDEVLSKQPFLAQK